MKLPAYPRYKPSGVEWLGDVPEHWAVKRISLLASREARSFTDGDWIESPYITDEGVRLLQTGNVGIGEYREQGYRYVTEETFRELRCTEVRPSDVLICRLAAPVGRACLAPDLGCKMITSVDVCILRPAPEVDPRFVVYFFSSKDYLDWLDALCRGSTRDRISRSMLGALRSLLPPLTEQRTIAAFLDRETGRLDRLVAKKRELIERLQEKRTALIARTVTRGLNPAAKLKPSDIEWLGDIPEHWEVKPLKWHSHCQSGDGISYEDVVPTQTSENRIPVIGGNGLMGFCEAANTHEPVIVIGRVGALCGNVHKIDPPAWITDNALVLRADARVFDRDYLAAVLKHRNLNELADKTAQPLITGTLVGDERVPRPPLPEQRAIAEYLDAETAKIDGLVAKVGAAVEQLQEYRTALITAAVTGKIDVRKVPVSS